MKLRRKLLSAGFALGATALTLTTSTFAWYTANNEVTVGTVNGRTSVNADTSSLYIAAAETYASSQTVGESPVTYVAPGAKVENYTTYGSTKTVAFVGNAAERELVPVSYNGANTYGAIADCTPQYASVETPDVEDIATYYERSGSEGSYTYAKTTDSALANGKTYYVRNADTVTYNTDSTGAYVYEFVLRFQVPNINGTKDIYVSKFDVENTAVATDSQQNVLTYDTNGVNTGLKSGGQYNVDMLHALKMTVEVTNLSSTGDYVAESSPVSTTIYDLDGYAVTSKDSTNIGTTANAVGYYNNVLGTNIVSPEDYLSAAKCVKKRTAGEASSNDQTLSKLFTVPSTGFVEVRFTFWLDGWDSFCYDVCRKQNFAVDMAFSTEASKSIWTAHTAATGRAAA